MGKSPWSRRPSSPGPYSKDPRKAEQQAAQWLRTVARLHSEECKGLHVLVAESLGFAHLTDMQGTRIRVDATMLDYKVSAIINRVKRVNEARMAQLYG